MPTDAEIRVQLQHLKAMTIRTGGIHEAQQLQMKRWILLFPNAEVGSKVRVDPEDKTAYYLIKSEKHKASQLFDNTCKAVEEWTRYILWNETRIVVKVNSKVAYESKS
jgi:hypothetical protein